MALIQKCLGEYGALQEGKFGAVWAADDSNSNSPTRHVSTFSWCECFWKVGQSLENTCGSRSRTFAQLLLTQVLGAIALLLWCPVPTFPFFHLASSLIGRNLSSRCILSFFHRENVFHPALARTLRTQTSSMLASMTDKFLQGGLSDFDPERHTNTTKKLLLMKDPMVSNCTFQSCVSTW